MHKIPKYQQTDEILQVPLPKQDSQKAPPKQRPFAVLYQPVTDATSKPVFLPAGYTPVTSQS